MKEVLSKQNLCDQRKAIDKVQHHAAGFVVTLLQMNNKCFTEILLKLRSWEMEQVTWYRQEQDKQTQSTCSFPSYGYRDHAYVSEASAGVSEVQNRDESALEATRSEQATFDGSGLWIFIFADISHGVRGIKLLLIIPTIIFTSQTVYMTNVVR